MPSGSPATCATRWQPPVFPTPCCIRTAGRFPESGWLEGSVADLADLIRLVSVPQEAVDTAAAALEQGIERAAVILNEMVALRPNITPAIARLLGMTDVPQTRRMAGAIIANALVFHQRIAGMHPQVKHLGLVCGPSVANPQAETLAAWTHILSINYWPIFAIARDILEQLPAGEAGRILAELRGNRPAGGHRRRNQRSRPHRPASSSGSLPTASTWRLSTPCPRPRPCWQGWR